MSQLLFQFDSIFKAAALPVWLRPYDILAVSASGGLIEAIPDTISLDALKKGDPHFTNLNDFFIRHFGRGNADSDAVKVCLFTALSLLVRGNALLYRLSCWAAVDKDGVRQRSRWFFLCVWC